MGSRRRARSVAISPLIYWNFLFDSFVASVFGWKQSPFSLTVCFSVLLHLFYLFIYSRESGRCPIFSSCGRSCHFVILGRMWTASFFYLTCPHINTPSNTLSLSWLTYIPHWIPREGCSSETQTYPLYYSKTLKLLSRVKTKYYKSAVFWTSAK